MGIRMWGGVVAACLLATTGFGGQSLAEVARKERERRVQVTKPGGPSAVISEKELEEARGDSYSVSGEESEGSAEPPEAVEDRNPPGGNDRLSAKEIHELMEQWGRIWQGQMEQAERELARAKDDVYQCFSASRYFFIPIAVDCDGVDLRLAGAQARLKRIRRSRYHWELLLPPDQKPGS